MTTIRAERRPLPYRVESITEQAREVHAGRVLLTLIAALFFGLGWIVAKTCAVAWLAIAWCAVATREGWREARKPKVSRAAA